MTPAEEQYLKDLVNAEAACREAEKAVLDDMQGQPIDDTVPTDLEKAWLLAATTEEEDEDDDLIPLSMAFSIDDQLEAFSILIDRIEEHNAHAEADGDRIVYSLVTARIDVIKRLVAAWQMFSMYRSPSALAELAELAHDVISTMAREAQALMSTYAEEDDEDAGED